MSKRKTIIKPTIVSLGGGFKIIHPPANAKVRRRGATLAQPVEESPWSAEDSTIIATFDDSVNRLIKELERRGRDSGNLEKSESFPTWRVRELRQKIIDGLAVWALTGMRRNRERFFREAVSNFLDRFLSHYFNPSRDTPRHFWDSFHQSLFRFPTKLPRTEVHHRDWPKLWREYKLVCDRLNEIPRGTRRITKTYLCALKETLPGFSDELLGKRVKSNTKPSDIAAEYVSKKFKLPVGGQALKEYFKVFQRPYGYYDFIATSAFKNT